MAIVQLERREFALSGQEKRGTVSSFFPHPTGQKLVTGPSGVQQIQENGPQSMHLGTL